MKERVCSHNVSFVDSQLSNRSLCEMIEALTPVQKDVIWREVGGQLGRLEANTSGHRSLLPDEKISVFRRSGEMSLTNLARSLGLSGKNRKGVKGAIRDVRAALSWLGDNSVHPYAEFIPRFLLSSKEEKRYRKLEYLQAESDKIRRIRENPETQKLLKNLPHVDKVLEAFEKTSTVGKLLIELDIPCQSPPVWACNRTVREFVHSNRLDGIRALADRVLFAYWLKHKSDFNGRDVDALISRAAVFLFSHSVPEDSSESFKNLVRYMRLFLREVLYIEFESVKRDWDFVDSDVSAKLFPRNDEQKADSFYSVDVLESYKAFSQYDSYPGYLDDFAREIVSAGKTYLGIAKDMISYPRYSRWSRRSFVWAGKIFLKSVLLANHNSIGWNSFKRQDLECIKALGDLFIQ